MRSFVKACIFSAFLLVFVLPAAGKELIRWSDIENAYDGSFGVPMASDADSRFGYSSGVHAQLSSEFSNLEPQVMQCE